MDLSEGADSEFRIAVERLFQRDGAGCEKARWCVPKECTVYTYQQNSGAGEKVHIS